MRERPLIFTAASMHANLAGTKTMTRRLVKAPRITAHPKSAGLIMHDLGRAWKDEGFGNGEYLHVPFAHPGDGWDEGGEDCSRRVFCPYGWVGDRLWCKETWRPEELPCGQDGIRFAADNAFVPIENTPEAADLWVQANRRDGKWRPSIFMPRWASRLSLELTSVRAERLNDLTEEDARAEGIRSFTKDGALFKFWPNDPHDGPLKCEWADLPRTARAAYARLWDQINPKHPWGSNCWVWVLTYRPIAADGQRGAPQGQGGGEVGR